MTTGVVANEPSPDWRGDTLAADVASAASTLTVDEALDFDEDATRSRWLVVGDSEPLEYVDVDFDTNVITLADPTTEDYEAGLPVVLWDPTANAKVVEYLAPVRLSDESGTVDAVIPHELVPLNGVSNLVGASVSLYEDGGDWYVGQVFAREAVVDSTTIDSTGQSYVTTRLYGSSDTQAIADSTWTNLGVSGSWVTVPTLENPDFTFDDVAGAAEILVAGWYLIDAQVRWVSNATGNRRLRIASYGQTHAIPVLFDDVELARQSVGPQSGQVSQHLHHLVQLQTNDSIRVQCWQNSGGSLDLIGTPTSPGVLMLEFPTYWTIRRAF